MKKLLIIGLIVAGLALVSACAPTYQIILKSGDIFEATSEPVLDKETGYLEYTDKDGKKVRLKEEDVMVIKEK